MIIKYLKYKKNQYEPYFNAFVNLIMFYSMLIIPFVIGIKIGSYIEEQMLLHNCHPILTYIFVIIITFVIGMVILFGGKSLILDYLNFKENQDIEQ